MAKVSGNACPSACPCGSKLSYSDCCALYLDGNLVAPTAKTLMRSRYTAYTLRREDYLLATWHTTTRPAALDLADGIATQWIGLEVKRQVLQDATHAIVEFVARYKINGRAHRLHEVSRFVREEGQWLYLDGETP
jgi:SEC-C motif-containing protein